MKRIRFLAGIISMLLIFGMALAGCDDGTNQTGDNTGLTGETDRATAAKPKAPAAPTGLKVTKPAIPSTPKVTITTSTSIGISWSPVTGANGYNVWRNTSPTGTYTRIASVGSTTYLNLGLKANTQYYYKVSAFNAAGDSKDKSPYVPAKTLK
jgi:hypothetical protein